MEGDRIRSETAGLDAPTDSALLTGPQATDNVEGDSGRLPASSEAQPGMNEGNIGAQSEEESRLGATGGRGRPLVTQADETTNMSSADREENLRLIRERRKHCASYKEQRWRRCAPKNQRYAPCREDVSSGAAETVPGLPA